MSIARMQIMHGLQISDDDRRTLVKYLADTQGLAPSETDGCVTRWSADSIPLRNSTTRPARCAAAVTPVRGSPCNGVRPGMGASGELPLGQWPSLEYQALSRDRDWFDLARKEMVPLLAKRYPLDNPAWKNG